MIDRAAAHWQLPRAILEGCPDWTLRRMIADDRDTRGLLDLMLLPGEEWNPQKTYRLSIYRILFADGAAYVGKTNQGCLSRISQHFGIDLDDPRKYHRGTVAILDYVDSSWSGKLEYRFECIATGLSRAKARDREKDEIQNLLKPLNTKLLIAENPEDAR